MDNIQYGSFYPNGKLHSDHKTYLERLREDLGCAIHYARKWHIGLGTAAEQGIEADISDGAAAGRYYFGVTRFPVDFEKINQIPNHHSG